jgi:hypothetical protein
MPQLLYYGFFILFWPMLTEDVFVEYKGRMFRFFGDSYDEFIEIDLKGFFEQNNYDDSIRIVACVNACVGIPTEVLSDPNYSVKQELDSLDAQIEARIKAEKERDELKAENDKLNARINAISRNQGQGHWHNTLLIGTRSSVYSHPESCPYCGATPYIKEAGRQINGISCEAVCARCKQ